MSLRERTERFDGTWTVPVSLLQKPKSKGAISLQFWVVGEPFELALLLCNVAQNASNGGPSFQSRIHKSASPKQLFI